MTRLSKSGNFPPSVAVDYSRLGTSGRISEDINFYSLSRTWEKRLSPRRAPRRSLLPLSPKRTQGSLKITPVACLAHARSHRTHGRPPGQECRLRLNGHRL